MSLPEPEDAVVARRRGRSPFGVDGGQKLSSQVMNLHKTILDLLSNSLRIGFALVFLIAAAMAKKGVSP